MTPPRDLGEGAAFDLSARAKLRISGPDRFRYLNGQISNDLGKATNDATLHACVLTAKGKINANVFIVADTESFLVDTDREMREGLPARLERYIIADDVQIEDVSDRYALLHVLGASGADLVERCRTVRANRFGRAGVDVWIKQADREIVLQHWSAKVPLCNEEEAEIFRMEQGIPRWGHELTEEIIPTEANLEAAAIDYAKGCYIGQEVISRIRMSGQTNKRLCGLASPSGIQLAQGMRLLFDRKDVGWITSAAYSPRLGKQIALGFVKRGFQAPGTRLDLLTGDANRRDEGAEIVPLPFS